MDFIEFFRFGIEGSLYSSSVFPNFPNDLYIGLLVGLIGYGIIYTFQAITLYTICKRNGFGHVWMAFVPFFNTYYLGVVSEKNKIFNQKPKYFSLALAIFEFILVAGWVLYYVSFFCLESTNCLEYVFSYQIGETSYYTLETTTTVPSSMEWMAWIYNYLGDILYYVDLVYVLLHVFVLISFFQTYAHGRYFIMALFSAIFPIAGLIMFFVRKNKPMNYRDYMRMVQEQRYRQYQQNQRYGNPYNYNPYNGNPNNYNNPNYNNPNYNNNANNAAGDPFDDLNSNSGNGNTSDGSADGGDPFEDF